MSWDHRFDRPVVLPDGKTLRTLEAPEADARPMTDQDLIIEAIEEAQRILAEYIETGPRDAP